jgi:CRP/FNR family transcriptional regulator
MSGCENCAARDHAICAALAPESREQLARLGRMTTVPRGQRLIWEGDSSMLVANVVEGALQLSISTGDGRDQIVGVVYSADFIGRPFGSTSPHNVTALSDSTVCVYPRATFDNFARDHPGLEHRLLRKTLEELDRARAWMLLLGRKSAQEKIATFLLEMSVRLVRAHDGADCAPLDRFMLPLDRQQVADILGMTIETVSRQLTDLKRKGIIALPDRRTIEIHDRQTLECLAESN